MASGRCHGQVNVDGTFLCDGWKSDHRAKRLLESRYRNCVVGPALVHIKWKKAIPPSSMMNAKACSPKVDSRYLEISPAPCIE